MIKELKNRAFYVAALLLAVAIAGTIGVVAYTGQNNGTVIENQVVQGDYVGSGQNNQNPTFGSGIGDRISYNELELGDALSQRLSFAAAATTTPGGLFRILNAGEARICTVVQLDITTATAQGGLLGTGAPLEFSVATSTSRTALSGNLGIIASTTLATSTTSLIDSVGNPGTYVGADQDIGGKSFVWGTGVYLLGQFDAYLDTTSRTSATSSNVYSGVAGKMYIDCHVR